MQRFGLSPVFLALGAAFLAQNAEEALLGGPVLPRATQAYLPRDWPAHTGLALLIVSLFGAVIFLWAAVRPDRRLPLFLAVGLAAALAANAAGQIAGSALAGRLLPGAVAGALLILPLDLLLLAELRRRRALPRGLLALAIGMGFVLLPPALVGMWHLAAFLAG